MWFAQAPAGHVLLLTPAFSVKADRWQRDPWVRLVVPGGGERVEAEVRRLGWAEAEPLAELLMDRFGMAGAATREGLRHLLETGERHLLLVGLPASP